MDEDRSSARAFLGGLWQLRLVPGPLRLHDEGERLLPGHVALEGEHCRASGVLTEPRLDLLL